MSGNGLASIPPPYAWKSLGMREIRYTGNKVTKIDLADGKRFWSHLESFYVGQNKLKEVCTSIPVYVRTSMTGNGVGVGVRLGEAEGGMYHCL